MHYPSLHINYNRYCKSAPTDTISPWMVKYYLKDHDQILQIIDEPEEILKCAFDSVSESQSNNWITHSGYGF